MFIFQLDHAIYTSMLTAKNVQCILIARLVCIWWLHTGEVKQGFVSLTSDATCAESGDEMLPSFAAFRQARATRRAV